MPFDFRRDPATIEITLLGLDFFVTDITGMHAAGVKRHVVLYGDEALGRIRITPASVVGDLQTDLHCPVLGHPLPLTEGLFTAADEKVEIHVVSGNIKGRRVTGFQHSISLIAGGDSFSGKLDPNMTGVRLECGRTWIIPNRFCLAGSHLRFIVLVNDRHLIFVFLVNDREGINTVAQTGGVGAIREDMSEVAIAFGADHFGPDHAVAVIADFLDRLWIDHVVEAGPTGTGIELGAGIKQGRTAARAMKIAIAFEIVIDPGPGAFGALLAEHMILLRSQLGFPVDFGFFDFIGHDNSSF